MTKFIAFLLLSGSAFAFITAQNWQIADSYNIAFSSDDAGGVFKGFKGAIAFDEQNPAASKFDVTIDVSTINTGNGLQNKHAKSDEWFDVAKYPQIHFASKNVAKSGNSYHVTGDLTLHGVTKSITFPFAFKKTPAGGLFEGSFTVNRNDYKLGKPGGDVGESIKIDLSVPVTK
ncbi:YceI family protein [Puia sp.]|uniref:YceI family protein n=1 Tax=Puia sp. TaxID=2045100 RepID=UPI002F3F13D1